MGGKASDTTQSHIDRDQKMDEADHHPDQPVLYQKGQIESGRHSRFDADVKGAQGLSFKDQAEVNGDSLIPFNSLQD